MEQYNDFLSNAGAFPYWQTVTLSNQRFNSPVHILISGWAGLNTPSNTLPTRKRLYFSSGCFRFNGELDKLRHSPINLSVSGIKAIPASSDEIKGNISPSNTHPDQLPLSSAIGSHLALNSGINNATSSPFSFQFWKVVSNVWVFRFTFLRPNINFHPSDRFRICFHFLAPHKADVVVLVVHLAQSIPNVVL